MLEQKVKKLMDAGVKGETLITIARISRGTLTNILLGKKTTPAVEKAVLDAIEAIKQNIMSV